MKFHIKLLIAALAISGMALVAQNTSVAAKSSYQIIKTKTYSPKDPFYFKGKGNAYMWNANHTKKILNLKNHPRSQWYRAKSVIFKHGAKKSVYYKMTIHRNNTKNAWDGYVWRGYLKKGYGPNYSGNYQIGYYQLTRDVAIKAMTQNGSRIPVTLPKGTVLRAATNVWKQKTMINFALSALNYQLLHQLGLDVALNMDSLVYSKDDLNPKVPDYLAKVAAPNFIIPRPAGDHDGLTSATWYNNLFVGKDSDHWGDQLPMLRTTTDGYLEYYGNITGSTPRFSIYNPPVGLAPTASQKILDATKSGNTLTLYYAAHMAGLNDEQITRNGQQEYRLTIESQPEAVKKTYRNAKGKIVDQIIFRDYLVGGRPFHVLDTELDVDN